MKKYNFDLLIAATAIVERLFLVARDGVFDRLAQVDPRLMLETWL